MDYIFAFVTALLTFISPCVLPMLPVFVSYFTAATDDAPPAEDADGEPTSLDMTVNSESFAASESGEEDLSEQTEPQQHETIVKVEVKKTKKGSWRRTLINAFGFAIGLMIVLVAIGALFGALGLGLGSKLLEYRHIINYITGGIVVFLGIAFTGLIKIPFLTGGSTIKVKTENMRFFSALLFGLVYALSFGPCVVTFGSFSIMQGINDAIMYGEIFKAVMLQVIFAGTLGLLFIISALLIDYLKGIFDFIKRHYRVINIVSGCILIVLGLLMAFGVIERLSGMMQGSFLFI